MSGGSFNYACFNVTDSHDVFKAVGDVKAIEDYLRQLGKHDAADEVYRYLNFVETCRRRLMIQGERITNLLQSAEWCSSGDTSPDGIDVAYDELMGKEAQS